MDNDMDLPPIPSKVSDFFASRVWKIWKIGSIRFGLVPFRSVPFSVPLFVCSLGNSEKKTEMHLFIAGQHAMQACQSGQAGRQAGKLTYIEFREHSELLIITNRAYIVYIPTIYICTCPCLTSHARTSQSSV